jgi:glycosyltransferase involved in cell wall biosynthesis
LPPLTIWRRRLRPAYLRGEIRRLAKKVVRRVTRPERRLVTLEPEGEARGRALVSYLVDGLLVAPGRPLPHSHTNYWESRQIARTFAALGYRTDVIHWTNAEFVPAAPYDVFVDVRLNMERLAPLVGDDCLRIQHIETAHHSFHNPAQLGRLEALAERRGVRLAPRKLIEENRAIETADCGIAVGNDFTIGTYAHAGKPVHRVPISVPFEYAEPDLDAIESRRRHFIWFGSGGLVHKGLDLVLEAFAGMPDSRLTVCGPISVERDFEAAYARELYATPNIETVGWVDVAGESFQRLCASALGIVYPSCSEGGGGSVITCMHAGLIPVVTREASVDLAGFGVEIPEGSVEAVRDSVAALASLPADELRRQATAARRHVRRTHTRESFGRDHLRVVSGILGVETGGSG